MTPAEVETWVQRLKAGAKLQVPFSTRLYPETEALGSVLRAVSAGAYELETRFREFWAGHGWSVEQRERETWGEDEVRQRLGWASAADVSELP